MSTAKEQARVEGLCEPVYLAYPRHVARKAAIAAICKAVLLVSKRMPEQDAIVWLTSRAAKYAESVAGRDKQYVPYPATWFNQGRYDDDDDEWVAWKTYGGSSGNSGDTPEFGGLDKLIAKREEAKQRAKMKKEMEETF